MEAAFRLFGDDEVDVTVLKNKAGRRVRKDGNYVVHPSKAEPVDLQPLHGSRLASGSC